MRTPTITVVTPWRDHMELAPDYWRAVGATDVQVLVIDNGSNPPLPNAVRSDVNLGFSPACNLGLSLATTDAVLFLNNDIYATEYDWVEPIRAALEPGVLVGACLRFDAHAEGFPYLDGWCLAGMTEDLRDLGGWDESLMEPSYYGDNLLCLEARAAGMTLREARVGLRHKGNGSARPDDPRVVAATVANRRVFMDRAHELTAVAA